MLTLRSRENSHGHTSSSFVAMSHHLSPEELTEFREIFNLVDRVSLVNELES